MAGAWEPGVLERKLGEVAVAGQRGLRTGLALIAAAIEADAKARLGERTHLAGTPSPASSGGPPALVTGTGRRSIGHQMILGIETIVKVGTQAGVYPPSSASRRGSRSGRAAGSTGHGKTPSSRYLLYQETLGRFNHPFLLPAYRNVVTAGVARWMERAFTWPRA